MSGPLQGRGGQPFSGRVPVDRRMSSAARIPIQLPPGASNVPLIGQRPHEVRIQVVTSDQAPPSVIELAVAFAGLLVRVKNWAAPIDPIKGGTERQARAMGDGPATIALLELLDATATRILAIREAMLARQPAQPEPVAAPEAPAPVLSPGEITHHEPAVEAATETPA